MPYLAALLTLLVAGWCSTRALAEAPAPAAKPVLNVCDFGARGDGVTDDAPAFRQTFAAALPGTTIRIPAGTYRLFPAAQEYTPHRNDPRVLFGENLKEVTICGEDQPLLVMGAPQHGLFFSKCRNLTVRNLRLDYDPLTFTQGTVTACDATARNFTVRVAPGYAPPDSPVFRGSDLHAVFLDPATRRWAHALGEAYVEKTTALPDGAFRLATRNQYSDKIPGNLFVLATRRRAEAVFTENSQDVLFENITIYSGPGTGFFSHRNDGLTLRACTIQQRPGTDRLYTTSADGFHCKQTRRPTVEFCNFTGMGDDAVNIASGPDRVCEQNSPVEIIVDPYFFLARAGDDIDFLDLYTGGILATRRVVATRNVAWRKEGKIAVTLDQPFAVPATVATLNLPAARERGGLNWMRSMRELPVSPTLVLCPATCGRGAVIRNNVFHNYRGRGIMLHAPDATVADNLFEHLAGPGIVIGDDLGWGEFGSGRGARVTGNLFRAVLRSNIQIAEAALPARAAAKDAAVRTAYAVSDVLIAGNRFEGYGADTWSYGRGTIGNVLSLADARHIVIRDNTFGPAIPGAVAAATILIGDSREVTLRGNAYLHPDKAVQLLSGADRATLQLDAASGTPGASTTPTAKP